MSGFGGYYYGLYGTDFGYGSYGYSYAGEIVVTGQRYASDIVVTGTPSYNTYSVPFYTSYMSSYEEGSNGLAQGERPGTTVDATRIGDKFGLHNLSAQHLQYNLLGKTIDVYLDNHMTAEQQKSVLTQLQGAVTLTNAAQSSLTTQQISNYTANPTWVISDQFTRGGTVVGSTGGVYGMAFAELQGLSAAYISSNIEHDGAHENQYINHQTYTGDSAEIAAWQSSLGLPAAIGLSTWEKTWIQSLVNDPASQHARENSRMVEP